MASPSHARGRLESAFLAVVAFPLVPGDANHSLAMLTSALMGGVTMIGNTLLASAASFVIVLLGMPNIEQSRNQARNAQAFILAQQIKSGSVPPDTVDLWDNQFDIQRTDSNEVTVVSRGSNMVTPTVGYDADDISTSMSDPPRKKATRRKKTQLLFTLALASLPWFVLSLNAVRRRSEQKNTLPQYRSHKSDRDD